MQLPESFLKSMKGVLGDELPQYLEAMEQPAIRAVRLNESKCSVEHFLSIQNEIFEPLPLLSNAFYLPEIKLGAEPIHHAGIVYSQEPSAMAPIECLDFEESWNVLDMCAAPGGKSTQAKSKIPNGVLVCNEVNFSRAKVLLSNIERLGLTDTAVICQKTDAISKAYPNFFDVCIVDAPCSGEGMFRKDETAIEQWSQELVELCAKRQKKILDDASKCVKGGGYIIYSTCTFSLEENEKVIDDFLLSHPSFKLVPVSKRVQNSTSPGVQFPGCQIDASLTRRFYPHHQKGEGQFMALLKRTDFTFEQKVKTTLVPEKNKLVLEFLKTNVSNINTQNVLALGGKPVIFNPSFPFPFMSALCCGVSIGEIKKNYILPHHQLFMAFGKSFKNKVELSKDDLRIYKYLKGEEIETDAPNGFAAVLFEGAPTGGGKVSNGKLKNHYPKGLRLIN